ncbi:MAG TPA: VOC family protein [Kofleriaceae bacterium]|jgi:catechol 2,3-dioxygenase-like lactoylglutathione lyase family enzyme
MATSTTPLFLGALIKAVDHVTIPVGDLDGAHAFYCDVLGAKLLERFDRELFLRYRPGREAELEGPNSPLHLSVQLGAGPRLDLFLQSGGQPATPIANPHIAFEVAGEHLDAARSHLVAAGIAVEGPTRLGPPGQASIYFFDPYGNKLELMTHAYPRALRIGAPNWVALAARSA